MNDRELLQQALDSLEWAERRYSHANLDLFNKPIEAIRTRLAQPEPEPVAWMYEFGTNNADAVNEVRWYRNVHLTKPIGMVRNIVPLYTAPPKKEWVGLTDKEVKQLSDYCVDVRDEIEFIRAIEEEIKEKNSD